MCIRNANWKKWYVKLNLNSVPLLSNVEHYKGESTLIIESIICYRIPIVLLTWHGLYFYRNKSYELFNVFYNFVDMVFSFSREGTFCIKRYFLFSFNKLRCLKDMYSYEDNFYKYLSHRIYRKPKMIDKI